MNDDEEEKCPECGRGIYPELLKEKLDGKYCACGAIIIDERPDFAEMMNGLNIVYANLKSEWKGLGRPDSLKYNLKALLEAKRRLTEMAG